MSNEGAGFYTWNKDSHFRVANEIPRIKQALKNMEDLK
jgi:hypothetical protein